jgi:small subunit ribosomal protein S21
LRPLKKIINQKKKEVFFMIVVSVKEGDTIDKALKKLKRKFEKTGVVRELRMRQKFTKPSVIRRDQKLKAIYVQKMLSKIAEE